jgi:acyl-CoA thioester hydrolase
MVSTCKIRVRYKDTDCSGLAMSDVDQKVHLPVAGAVVRYVRPAKLDELLDVRCWISERERASFRFAYEIGNEAGERVATGSTLHACWDPQTSKMIAVPDWLQAAMPVASGGESSQVRV